LCIKHDTKDVLSLISSWEKNTKDGWKDYRPISSLSQLGYWGLEVNIKWFLPFYLWWEENV